MKRIRFVHGWMSYSTFEKLMGIVAAITFAIAVLTFANGNWP